MTDVIAKLYDKAIVIESTDDYVAGELDPEKFAKLVVMECASLSRSYLLVRADRSYLIHKVIMDHFGVE